MFFFIFNCSFTYCRHTHILCLSQFSEYFRYTFRRSSGCSKCGMNIRKCREVKACVNWLSMQQQLITIKLYCHTPFRHLKNSQMPLHPFSIPPAQSTTGKSITCRLVDAQHVSSLVTIILIKTFIFRHTMEKFSSRSLLSSSQCWGMEIYPHLHSCGMSWASWVDVGIKHTTYWRLWAYRRALETTWHLLSTLFSTLFIGF